jgi:hypothetical protein
MRLTLVRLLLPTLGALSLQAAGCSATVPPVAAVDVVRAARPEDDKPAGEPFRLPEDEAGKLVGRAIQPAPRVAPLSRPNLERPALPPPPAFAPSLPPLPAVEVSLPRLAPKKKAALRPHLVAEEGFEDSGPGATPSRVRFTTEDRLRVESPDVSLPPPLPILAGPTRDAVTLEDATGPASTASALAAPLPDRARPAPYQRLTLPDPYENRRPLTLTPPAESSTPQAGTPQVAKP